jgi:hypothetical protein
MTRFSGAKRFELCSRIVPSFLIVLFALPALWLLLREQHYCTHDGSLHFYRLVALRHAIEQGLPFSRWTPGLVYGYGFPFFNFREIASYYLPEALHLLGLSIPTAINLVYAGSILLSGWGTYLLACDIWRDRTGGVLAAVAYMLAPYQLLDLFVRGNLPESIALALLPWIVWLFRQLIRAPGPRTFVPATLSVVLLLLTHNISSLLFLPLLVLYLAGLLLLQRRPGGVVFAAVAILIAVAISAFGWLPAIAERESVQLYLTHSTRGNDFHFNFLSLTELLSPPGSHDPSLMNPPLRVNLGLPQLVLGAIALAGLFFRRQPGSGQTAPGTGSSAERRWHLGLLALATCGLLLFSLPVSTLLWEKLPLIRFVQFPWRFVGRASLPLALLAGVVPSLIPSRARWAPVLTACAIIILGLASFPWLYPRSCSYPSSPTIATVMDFERSSGLTGVDPLGAYLPRWVSQRPESSPMEAALREGVTPRRFDRDSMPAEATLLRESYGPNQATIELDTPDSFQAIYHTFYFSGWTVRIDGERVPIDPLEGTGLISFLVPSGQHSITIRWELNPLRRGAALLSLVGLVALVLVSRSAASLRIEGVPTPPIHRAGPWLLLLVLALALPAIKAGLVDSGHTPLYRSGMSEEKTPDLQNPLLASFADGPELLGYRIDPAPAGSEFRVDLAWTARQPPEGNYASRIAMVDAEKLVWSAKETFRPRGYQPHPPTYEWRPGAWVWDSHSIPILPGTPPGSYQLILTLFDRATLAPLNVLDATGQVLGPELVLGALVVERPETSPAHVPMQYRIDHRWGDLTLLGANLDRSEAYPGSPALVTLFWEARAHLPPLTAQVELLDPSETVVRAWQIPLVRDDYAPPDWRVGDKLMGQHLFSIPGRADNGEHIWRLTVLDAVGTPLEPSIALGSLTISAPDRLWEAPAGFSSVDIQYALPSGLPFAQLLGYRLERSSRELDVSLVWRAQAETETSYRVYLQLMNPGGDMASQADGIPVAWSRPTPGWAPGEYLVDPHQLPLPDGLPSGAYVVVAGLYDPATGDRLEASQEIMTEITLP